MLVCILLITATACGKRKQEEDNENPKTTIRIAWWGGQNRHAYTEELLRVYEKSHPDIRFEPMPEAWDGYFDKLSTWAALGEMPDIVQMDYQYIDSYTKNGALADLRQYVDERVIDVSDVDGELLASGEVDGRLTGIAISSSILCIGYSPSLLQQAGVEEPENDWTWGEFLESAESVSAFTGQPSIMTAAGITNDTNIFRYWVRQHGEELFNKEGTALGFDDISITAEFFAMWKKLMEAGVSPDPDETAQITSRGQDANPLVKNEAAYIFEWHNYAVKMEALNPKIKIVVPPLAEDSSDKGLWMKPGMFLSVSEKSQEKKECAEFINWVINSKEANDIILAERGVPVSEKIRAYLSETGKISEQQKEMFSYTDVASDYLGAVPPPEPKGIQEVNKAFDEAGNRVFFGDITALGGAREFHKQANQILSQYGKKE